MTASTLANVWFTLSIELRMQVRASHSDATDRETNLMLSRYSGSK
jgi:hypothetical protein